jgi:hypothetical protein
MSPLGLLRLSVLSSWGVGHRAFGVWHISHSQIPALSLADADPNTGTASQRSPRSVPRLSGLGREVSDRKTEPLSGKEFE